MPGSSLMPSSAVLRTTLAVAFPVQALLGQQSPDRQQQVARAMIEAFNGTDQQSLRAFIQQNVVLSGPGVLPPDERLARWIALRAQYAPLSINRVAAGDPNTVVVTTQSGRTELWRRLTFTFDGGTQPRIR